MIKTVTIVNFSTPLRYPPGVFGDFSTFQLWQGGVPYGLQIAIFGGGTIFIEIEGNLFARLFRKQCPTCERQDSVKKGIFGYLRMKCWCFKMLLIRFYEIKIF